MRRIFLALCSLCCIVVKAQNNHTQFWDALNQGNRAKTAAIMSEALVTQNVTPDQFLSYVFLNEYNGKDDQVTDFKTYVYDKASDPYPYIYALWFSSAVLGEYGKKALPHLTYIETIQVYEKSGTPQNGSTPAVPPTPANASTTDYNYDEGCTNY